MISSLFLVNWIYTIIDFCMRSDNAVMEKISDEMIVQINYGYSSALAWVYFLIVMVIIGISLPKRALITSEQTTMAATPRNFIQFR